MLVKISSIVFNLFCRPLWKKSKTIDYTKQHIELSLTVDYANVYKCQKHVNGSKMRQPFG